MDPTLEDEMKLVLEMGDVEEAMDMKGSFPPNPNPRIGRTNPAEKGTNTFTMLSAGIT